MGKIRIVHDGDTDQFPMIEAGRMQNIKYLFHPTSRCNQENLSRTFPPWWNRLPVSLEQEIHDVDGKRIEKKEVDHPPTRNGKDPVEHKRGKGDSNSEKYIVFQDLKELI